MYNKKTPLFQAKWGLQGSSFGILLVSIILSGLFLFVFPKPAHASIFSFLGDLLKSNNDQPIEYNSQTAPLLSAPQSSDVFFGTGGSEINIVGGQSLLPNTGPMGSIVDVETYKLDQITTYTVRNGDTLSEIADMFDVSVNTIMWANDLKRGDIVRPGDVLIILPVSGIQYTVKKGDTIEGLVKRFKSDSGDIIVFNGLNPEKPLEIGSTIIIPDAEFGIPALPNNNSSSGATRRSSQGPDLGGYFLRPIDGGRKSQGIHGYNGVDLASSCGESVYASASGDVLIAKSTGWNGGFGEYIVIAHPNGTKTLYAHLSSILVGPGWHVTRGMKIGTIGSTGRSTGCHVHFEVRGAKNPF